MRDIEKELHISKGDEYASKNINRRDIEKELDQLQMRLDDSYAELTSQMQVRKNEAEVMAQLSVTFAQLLKNQEDRLNLLADILYAILAVVAMTAIVLIRKG